jgi:hypothetical protein
MKDDFYTNKVLESLFDNTKMEHSLNGASFMAGTGGTGPNNIGPGDYYAIHFGPVLPLEIKVTFGKYAGLYDIDGTSPTGGEPIILSDSYFSTGEYFSMQFQTLLYTGPAKLKVYKK